MERWLIYFGVLCLALALVLLYRDRRRIHKERLRMTKLRNSRFYRQMYETIRFARSYELDQVRIEYNRVVFSAVCPPGKLCECAFRANGFRTLADCRTRVLTEVLGEDIPALQSNRYSLKRYRVVRPNGQKDYGYVYTLRPAYKTMAVVDAKRYAVNRV